MALLNLASLLVLFQLVCFALAQCPWTQSGVVYWSQASTWSPNPVPTSGSKVIIPTGKKVIYDVSTPGITYAGIIISSGSELIFDGTKDCWLETSYIHVNVSGAFRIGSSSCHHPTKATIMLVGSYDTTTQIVPHVGTKNVIVQGLLEWYGNPPQPTWTSVAATVPVNANQITVKNSISNWKVGDSIAIASTDYYQDLTEQFTIAAISGNTITLSGNVKYMHYGAENEFAEVGHLTRNILVMGDPNSDAGGLGFGGHCIVIGQGIAHVYGVEFTRMGQKGVLARYPFHFHFMGDQIGKGHFVSECSFHHNYQRCLTVHGTSGVMVRNNVGYNVTGHCYFLEEGSETYNVYDHNLGMVVNPGPMIPSDKTPSIFWITNPNNSFTNNVAVGGIFGFWFSLPLHPIGMSSGMTNVYPRYIPLGQFDNNLAHSADDSGIFADNGPDANGNTDEECSYTPLQGPYTSDSYPWNTPIVRATLNGNIAYKNRQHGIWFRASQITVKNSLLQDNGVGINMPTTGNILRDSVVVGETANIGTPSHTQWFNDFGRSRPLIWWAEFPIQGFQGYDNGGGQFVRNVTFVNFVSNSVRRAGAIGAITDGIFVLPPNDMFAQVTLVNANAWAMPDIAYNDINYIYSNFDGPRHIVMLDTDGSLTGAYGGAIASNGSIINEGNCVPVSAWNNYFNCSRSVNGYSQLTVNNLDTANSNFGNSLNYLYRATFIPFGKPTVIDNVTGGDPRYAIRDSYTTNVPSRKGYLLKFPHPTPYSLQVNLRFASTGEWIVLALQYPNTTFSIKRGWAQDSLIAVSSLSLLTKSTYYYDAVNEYLYVMYYEEDGYLQNNAGFPEYGYGGSYLNIVAGCGTNCVVGNHAVPSTYADNDDKYQVSLKGCGAGTASSHVGVGYFYFNRKTHVVNYLIYHNIPDASTAQILVGGRLYQTLPVGQAPIRGAFEISWNKWNGLWNGTWTVIVKSNSYPNGEIGGTVGCLSQCQAPPKISGADPCAVKTGQNVLYGDIINTTSGWYAWPWNIIENQAYSADKRCGAYSYSVQYGTWGSMGIHMGVGECNPGACTQSWQVPYLRLSAYTHLQFNVKSPSGPLPVPLNVRIQNSVYTDLPTLTVNFGYIDNYIIEETWTRVKIPLTALASSSELVGYFGFNLPAVLNNHTLLFDDVKLIPNVAETLTLAPFGTQRNYTASSC